MGITKWLALTVALDTLHATLHNAKTDALINGAGGSHPGGFPTLQEATTLLDQFVTWNPLFTGKMPVGVSYQCRIMWAYWVSGLGAVDRLQAKSTLRNLQTHLTRSIWEEEKDWINERCLSETPSNATYQGDRETIKTMLKRGAKFTDLAESAEKPSRGKLLLTALHHAREPTSLTAPLHTFHRLVGTLADWYRVGQRPVVKGNTEVEASHTTIAPMMIDREVVFLPFVNPDGYVAIETTKNQNVRKNQRPTCSNETGFHVAALNGVDLNRNYDNSFVVMHNKCDPEEYEGSEAFSESETRAVRRLAQLFRPQIALNFHAYGDIWTRPWNCCPDKALNRTEFEVFREINSVLNVSNFGSAPELEALGYATTGEADDYLLEKFGIISLSPEVGPESAGFYPTSKVVREVNAENTPRTLRILLKAGPELSATVAATQCRGQVDQSQGSGPSWGLIIFNSGLASTGPARLHVEFRGGQVKSDGNVNMTLGFYANNQFDLYKSFDIEDDANAPAAPVSMPATVFTVQNDNDVSIHDNHMTVTIPGGIEARKNYELSMYNFSKDQPMPAELEVCLSSTAVNDDANLRRDDLNPLLARARCMCGRMSISTIKGGCPFDKQALRFNPEVGPTHACVRNTLTM